MIMGLVYKFALNSLERASKKSTNTLPTLQHLKSYLVQIPFEKEALFVCVDDCLKCFVRVDRQKTIQTEPIFEESPRIYRYDAQTGTEEIEPPPFFDSEGVEHDTCFSYRFFKNGVGEQLVVEYKNKVFDLSEYFEETKVYDSLEAFKEAKESLLQKVLS